MSKLHLRRSHVGWLVLVLALALAVRLAAGVAWQSRLGERRFEFGDSETYWSLARSIARGEAYEYADNPVFRTPGYPLLLAPLFLHSSADPPVVWARALSAVFGVLGVLAVWLLARRLAHPRAALAAAAAAALYPGQVVLGALVLSEAPFCAAMVGSLAIWAAACRSPSVGSSSALSLGAGLASGVAVLIRPSWLLFAPLACVCFLVFSADRRRVVREALFLFLGLTAVLTPWWIRNYHATGHFVPTTLQVGASLYDGLNPRATGASDMRFVEEHEQAAPHRELTKAEVAFRLDRQLRAEAIDWAAGHPKQALRLAAVKFWRLWNVWPNEPRYSSWGVRLFTIFTYVPALILGIIGAYWTIGRGRAYWLCWLPAVYLTALHLVFVSSIRYREPAMLPLVVLAAVAVLEKNRGKGTKGQDAREMTNDQIPMTNIAHCR